MGLRNLTWAKAKTVIAPALGFCTTDARALQFANQAEDRLLQREDDPAGSIVTYRFCTTDYCLVLPRQIQTVLGFDVCGVPGVNRPIWYAFHKNGPGRTCPQDQTDLRMEDMGTVCCFQNVEGDGKYIRVYAQNAADAGSKIILKYYREDTRQKFYSSIDGVVQEGEEITLVAPPAYAVTSTTVMPGGLYSVIKDETDYPVDLFEYDGVTNTANLAFYEPGETHPIYRKVFVPGLAERGSCSNTCDDTETCEDDEDDCHERVTVEVLARLQHVPIRNDHDSFIVGNIEALKLMAMSIQRELQERFEESAILEAKALREIKGELASYHEGEVTPLQVQNRQTFGIGNDDGWGWGYGWF